MSSSRQFFDGGRQGKGAEKSNFVRTCNLLSQYVKEKGSLRGLNLENGGKVESFEALMKPGSGTHAASASTTMNLLTRMEKTAPTSAEQPPAIDYIPRFAINTLEEASNKVVTSKDATVAEAKAAPLTIFYSGRVLVFEDYPADKANELVTFAKNISPQMPLGILANTSQQMSNPSNFMASAFTAQEGYAPHKPVGILTNTLKETPIPSTSVAVMSSSRPGERIIPRPESANGSDLPIARRSSLHRFLEKRKDRAAARGPYQVRVQEQPGSSAKGDEQLELKL